MVVAPVPNTWINLVSYIEKGVELMKMAWKITGSSSKHRVPPDKRLRSESGRSKSVSTSGNRAKKIGKTSEIDSVATDSRNKSFCVCGKVSRNKGKENSEPKPGTSSDENTDSPGSDTRLGNNNNGQTSRKNSTEEIDVEWEKSVLG